MVQRIQQRMPKASQYQTGRTNGTGYDERESLPAQGIKRDEKGKSLLKKSSGILCKGTRLEAYRFLDQHRDEFGTRWLLRRLGIYPNAYYNYRKQRKAEHFVQKAEVCSQIEALYHQYNGTPGYRSITVYLERKGYQYSPATIHRYMNQELGLHSIVRPKRPGYERGKPHKVFENKLHQNFTAQEKNQKWCTDFTYLFWRIMKYGTIAVFWIYMTGALLPALRIAK